MLIDIHTHIRPAPSPNLCFFVGEHSLGIHPWLLLREETMDSIEQKFGELKANLSPRVLAVGECGLDRVREGLRPIEDQLEVLSWHLDWARSIKRPMILHCVRAHSDLLMILKKKKFEGKILLHDFNGNLTEAMKFLGYDCYFSFGPSFFRKQTKTPQVFKTLPVERVFLETDDQTEFSIDAIYDRASEIKNVQREILEAQFSKNLLSFFGDLNDVSPSDLIDNLSIRA